MDKVQLIYQLNKHGLTLSPGEKTVHVIGAVLESFSVSQTFSFIWTSVTQAAAFYVRERVPKQHAANTVIGSIQRQADRAKSENWQVKGYERNYDLRQSMVSQVFSNAVMQFGNTGFKSPVSSTISSNEDKDGRAFDDV